MSLAALAAGLFGITGAAILTSGPATAAPPQIQCTNFSGAGITDTVSNCTNSPGQGQPERGSGTIDAAGSHILTWDKGFLGGRSFQLSNINFSPGDPVGSPGNPCPSEYPVEVLVGGTVLSPEPYAGAPVSATICANPTTHEFIEEPGIPFTIG
jgi:hypothetical protein